MKSPAQQTAQRTLWKKGFFCLVKSFILLILALCIFLNIGERSFAANGINRVINFQGKLINKSDSTNITNGTYSFTFKLYDAATSGNLLWSETQSSVTVTNGIFQVSLGSTTPFNSGGYNVNFNQNSLYLDITFNSETFGSRVQLSAVPYAVNSEQLDGVIATQSATGFNLAGGMSTPSVASFTTAASTLTFQPGIAEALSILSNGGNALTLDTGSSATLNIANNNATTVQFGGSQNATFTFSGTGTFTTSSGLNTLGGNVTVNGATVSLANASSSTIQTTGANTGLTLLSKGSGNITLGQNLGNGNVVVQSNAGGQAALMVIDQGSGDLFTASSSGLTRFTVQQNGAIIIGADGVPFATTIRGGAATGSNVAGANLTFDASDGTGSGGSGDLIFRTAGAAGGGGSVGSDTPSAAQHAASLTCSPTCTLSWSYTVGSNSNRLLLVGISTYATSATSVTYGGVSLTKLSFIANGSSTYSEIWYLKNPTSGPASIVITMPSNVAIVTGSVSYYNVDQSSTFGTAATNKGTSVTATNAVSGTTTSQTIFDNFSYPANVGGWTTSQTLLWQNSTSNGGGSSNITGSSSTTNITWTNSSTGEAWADVAVPINPLSSGSSTSNTLTDRLHITASGNVGIGTATPYANLDVAGTNTLFETGIVASVGNGASGNGSNAVINTVGDQGSMIPNAGFESDQLGGFADGWFVAATNSATISRDTTTQAKGNTSLKIILNSAATAIYSTCIPVAGTAGGYTLNYYVKGTSPFTDVIAYVDGYTSEANCQSDTSNKPTAPKPAPVTTAWTRQGTSTTAVGIPSNQTWGRVHFLIGCPAASCSSATVELDGVRLTESTTGQGLDYAENYPADPTNMAQVGQLVALNPSAAGSAQVIPATSANDTSVIGVVSSNPGEVLDDGSMPDPKVPVALAGRIPTNVSTKNGAIHLGDYLTASDIPGVAVKATKAGQVIGIAMQDDTDTNPNDVNQVVMFVKNTYFAGISMTQGVSDALAVLGTAIQQAATVSANFSVTSTDRLVAGLDVITPKLVADSVFTNTISASSGHDVTVSLSNGSLILKNNAGASVIQFDDQGNAFIKGTLTVDTLQANHIRGLDIVTNQLTQLSSKISSLSANLSVLGAETTATSSADTFATPSGVMIKNLSAGLATISADFRVKGNGLFESMLSVIDTLSTNNFLVNGMSDFFSSVIFHGDVQFAHHPTFGSDTAGTMVIPKGQDHVTVNFTHEYQTAPIVTATIANNDQLTSQTILSSGYAVVVTNITPSGFTLLLNKTAQQNMSLSWIAVSIASGQVFSLPTPTPIFTQNTDTATGSATP